MEQFDLTNEEVEDHLQHLFAALFAPARSEPHDSEFTVQDAIVYVFGLHWESFQSFTPAFQAFLDRVAFSLSRTKIPGRAELLRSIALGAFAVRRLPFLEAVLIEDERPELFASILEVTNSRSYRKSEVYRWMVGVLLSFGDFNRSVMPPGAPPVAFALKSLLDSINILEKEPEVSPEGRATRFRQAASLVARADLSPALRVQWTQAAVLYADLYDLEVVLAPPPLDEREVQAMSEAFRLPPIQDEAWIWKPGAVTEQTLRPFDGWPEGRWPPKLTASGRALRVDGARSRIRPSERVAWTVQRCATVSSGRRAARCTHAKPHATHKAPTGSLGMYPSTVTMSVHPIGRTRSIGHATHAGVERARTARTPSTVVPSKAPAEPSSSNRKPRRHKATLFRSPIQ